LRGRLRRCVCVCREARHGQKSRCQNAFHWGPPSPGELKISTLSPNAYSDKNSRHAPYKKAESSYRCVPSGC
jgi:hypothetical protein